MPASSAQWPSPGHSNTSYSDSVFRVHIHICANGRPTEICRSMVHGWLIFLLAVYARGRRAALGVREIDIWLHWHVGFVFVYYSSLPAGWPAARPAIYILHIVTGFVLLCAPLLRPSRPFLLWFMYESSRLPLQFRLNMCTAAASQTVGTKSRAHRAHRQHAVW